jgi:hypothetical protein
MSLLSISTPPSSISSCIKPDDQGSKQKTKKSTTICPARDEIHLVDRLQDLAPEVITRVWFSQKELNETMLECRQTVRQMRDGVPLADGDDDSGLTSRGLEYCTPDGFDITTSSLDVVKLILEEQQRQRAEGIADPEMLAAAVGGISRHRQRIAHLAAMKDARVVYGDERQWTTSGSMEAPSKSSSFNSKREPRRGRLGRSGSFGAMEEKVRRRRGSRGPLGERDSRKALSNAT